jgi:S1-C subfamily serine protease
MIALALLASVIIHDDSPLRQVADRLHGSVIAVHGQIDSTGVLVGQGLALTTLHSIARQEPDGRVIPSARLNATVFEQGELPARIVAVAPDLDLAVLRIEGIHDDLALAAPLSADPPSDGESMVAMGADTEQVLAAGVTVNKVAIDGIVFFSSSRSVDSRFWGGPLFDSQGRFAAMVLPSPGQTKAVSALALRPLLEQAAAVH